MKIDLGSFLLGISLSSIVLLCMKGAVYNNGIGKFHQRGNQDDFPLEKETSSLSTSTALPFKKEVNPSSWTKDVGQEHMVSSSISSKKRALLFDTSSHFQIKTSADNGLCLHAKGFSDKDRLELKACIQSEQRQIFSIDEYGRIFSSANETACLSTAGKKVKVKSCAPPSIQVNQFSYDLFDDTLFLKSNHKHQVLTVIDGSSAGKELLFAKLAVRSFSLNDVQRWTLSPIDNPSASVYPSAVPSVLPSTTPSSMPITTPSQPDITYVGECGNNGLLCKQCEGDCDSDSGCEGNLICKQRGGIEPVPGCKGEGGSNDKFAKDICYDPINDNDDNDDGGSNDGSDDDDDDDVISGGEVISYKGNPCQDLPNDKCSICSGDCDQDSDCDGALRCTDRGAGDVVPGCDFGNDPEDLQSGTSDYCFLPQNVPAGVINYVGECGDEGYLCKRCEGDCDSSSDCEGNLICMRRNGFEPVPGCEGEGGTFDLRGKDICYDPQNDNDDDDNDDNDDGGTGNDGTFQDSLQINEEGCSSTGPCEKCFGPCLSDEDCGSGLTCFIRNGDEPIPGCVTGSNEDIENTNYCHEMPSDGPVTYIPGDLKVRENGLLLSTGLTSRIIASSGDKVDYANGGRSSVDFHDKPDGAAVFSIDSGANSGGWMYVSNAEVGGGRGGVGSITFNADGEVIDYEMIVTGTSRNCGGGKTYWGTWVTCEETSSGQVHEVNPFIGRSSQQETVMGGTGGDYESFAYDARDRFNPTFYVTNDDDKGGLVRFTPDSATVAAAEASKTWNNYKKVLTTEGALHWLVLSPNEENADVGTFSWTSNRREGDENARRHYRKSEGIDIRNGLLYFVTKDSKKLFILDLDAKTYERSSTESGAFNNQPDQIARILSDDPENDMLYFCEDGGSDCGLHARDNDGNYFSIIDGPGYGTETTGLGFSPDNKRMYISFQSPGIIFEITRTDGYPFGAHRLDIKYHSD